MEVYAKKVVQLVEGGTKSALFSVQPCGPIQFCERRKLTSACSVQQSLRHPLASLVVPQLRKPGCPATCLPGRFVQAVLWRAVKKARHFGGLLAIFRAQIGKSVGHPYLHSLFGFGKEPLRRTMAGSLKCFLDKT